jgi:hypothetical protein
MGIQENHTIVLQMHAELLQLVKVNKSKYKTFELDCTVRKHGHKAVRLLTCHCNYNPIELLWAQVNSYIVVNSNTFKITNA